MLSEKEIRRDLEKTARQIVSRKTWPILEASLFLGYSRQHMYLIAEKKKLYFTKVGGKYELYAIDILEIFEENCGFSFGDLSDNWKKHYGINTSSEETRRKYHG